MVKFDKILANGYIIDGTGNTWYKADIGIKDGMISKISPVPLRQADRVIDVKGLFICPGFINLHSHSDSTILFHNNAENCLAMGLVTELTGHCGSSVTPLTKKYRKVVNDRMKSRSFNLIQEEVDWLTLDEWRRKLEKKGIGINIAPLVGHGTLRNCVMGVEGEGGERVVPTKGEMEEMKAMLNKEMKNGAFGLSTGLVYAPGSYALTIEIIELGKMVAKYGGVYASHMRCEADKLIEATQEFIEICEKTGIRGTISHHKSMGIINYGKPNETIRMVERARARGIDIIIDQYPWRVGGGIKSLGSRFKKAELDEKPIVSTREELIQKLKNPEEWIKLKTAILDEKENHLRKYKEQKKKLEKEGGWMPEPNSMETGGTILYSKTHPELEWRSFKDVANAFGEEDIWEGLRKLLIKDDGWTCALTPHATDRGNPYSEDDIITILSYPWTTVSTDASAFDISKIGSLQNLADNLAIPHPRGWGTYAKILGKYVREEKILTLEEAIRKMTSLPARFLGLQKRGIVREGFYADLVVFDPDTVENVANYGNPCLSPKGIPYVIVNGELAIEKGIYTGIRSGKVLRYSL